MPDEIPWPTPEEEKALDRINSSIKPTAEELAETDRRTKEADEYRRRLEADRGRNSSGSDIS